MCQIRGEICLSKIWIFRGVKTEKKIVYDGKSKVEICIHVAKSEENSVYSCHCLVAITMKYYCKQRR